MRKLLVFSILAIWPAVSYSYDFYWTGNYSAEGVYLSGVDLGNGTDGNKQYLNHHLFVKPEIIFYEGLSFHGGLDVLNGDDNSVPNTSRVGQILGGNISSNQSTYSQDVPAPFVQRQFQKSRAVNISEAYLKYSHTSGELRFGRQPLEFGYGAFFNAGYNPFDHYYTNRDGISYKFTMGALSFNPVLNFLSDSLGDGSQSSEFGLKFGFTVEDTGLDLGFMVLQRHTPQSINALNPVPGGEFGASKPVTYSVYFNRKLETLSYGFEALAQDGSAGADSAGNNISLKGFGIAAQVEWQLASKWKLSNKFGYASGNDPQDTSEVSSVAMHRNYNLGLILFNHPLGDANYDPTGTTLRGRNGSLGAAYSPDRTVDTDSISNAKYLAPSLDYRVNRKWKLNTTVVMAWLNETNVAPGGGEVSSYLGTELDFTFDYQPTENIIISTTAAYFAPGGAFEGAGAFSADNSFGVTTRLGVTF
jgi:hypothetical protein